MTKFKVGDKIMVVNYGTEDSDVRDGDRGVILMITEGATWPYNVLLEGKGDELWLLDANEMEKRID